MVPPSRHEVYNPRETRKQTKGWLELFVEGGASALAPSFAKADKKRGQQTWPLRPKWRPWRLPPGDQEPCPEESGTGGWRPPQDICRPREARAQEGVRNNNQKGS